MERDWWGEIPANCNGGYGDLTTDQINRFFTFVSSSVSYAQVKCDASNTKVCGATCPEGSGIIPGIPPPLVVDMENENGIFTQAPMYKSQAGPQDLTVYLRLIRQHIDKNEIDQAYQIIAIIIVAPQDASSAALASSWALQFELQRANKKIESLQYCMSRLELFLSSHLNIASRNDEKAALLYNLGHAFGSAGDLLSVDQVVQQLRIQFSNSEYATKALDLAQLVAMARRDTVGVDNAIAQMIKEGVGPDKLRFAEMMRIGFLRVKPRDVVNRRLSVNPKFESQFGYKAQPAERDALTVTNYPNPFNPSTTIEYYLPQATHVALTVYNRLGQKVVVLVDEVQAAGKHFVHFNGKSSVGVLPSGMYFYTLTTTEQTVTRKFTLMK